MLIDDNFFILPFYLNKLTLGLLLIILPLLFVVLLRKLSHDIYLFIDFCYSYKKFPLLLALFFNYRNLSLVGGRCSKLLPSYCRFYCGNYDYSRFLPTFNDCKLLS